MKILSQYSDYNHLAIRRAKNEYGGLGYYRIIKPTQQVKSHEVRVVGTEVQYEFGENVEEQWDTIFNKFDAFHCLHFADPRAAVAIVLKAQEHGKKFILDIDDNYLDVPESNKEHKKFKAGKMDRANLSTILSLADAITVSTEPLMEKIHSHIKKVHNIDKPMFLVPNMNDVNDWKVEIAPKHKDRFVIAYTGSNSHHDDLKMVLPHIRKIMEKYPHVWFEILGVLTKEEAMREFTSFPQALRNRIGLVPAVATFKEYPEWLGQQRWNVGIAPLVDSAFTRCKSHIKWIEYAMVKMPTIASRVYPYFMELNGRQTVIDDENGWLAEPRDWFDKLERCVLNPELCVEMGEKAYQYVKDHWQYDQPYYDKVFNDIMNLPKGKAL